jgi:hypothetical protein
MYIKQEEPCGRRGTGNEQIPRIVQPALMFDGLVKETEISE